MGSFYIDKKKYPRLVNMSHYKDVQSNSYNQQAAVQEGAKESPSVQSAPILPTGDANMTEIQFEDIFIRFPKGNLDTAETAKEFIEMQIKKLKRIPK